ncbi:hypothetical protein CHLNCDRAFT_24359 [Chlorella variabilis]|uniref:Tyrosine-protein kinase ephrin type A/B receptor-like domain-containing protein n=1 Tax=Chlorella variabilis TaxID=554065 RepID=E1ZGW2_CHLVA|nr:hypothetical protein CHLNCDRAFT_24359 [Chlorella variabilis]EFN55009.1 hypothetical protein CHLNCDRAFT_24359 [Chlorella variabilis]|eukprot:XP_005847111.1 hypothetical protein CHLNCDRAFT_24359 [Chlorella variabilis]
MFNPVPGGACRQCPVGTFRVAGGGDGTQCTKCPPGTFTDLTGQATCTPCATGYANADTAVRPTHRCAHRCPKGYGVADEGNSACDVCGPGTYQDEEGQVGCNDCPVGTYTEMTGSTELEACLPAPKGNYAPGTGNDGFIPCEGGTYQDEEGQGACKPCPPGNQCPAGSVEPKKCRPGFYADSRQPFCKECAKGTYQDKEGQRACKPCPAGSYCQATKMATPTACPAGKFVLCRQPAALLQGVCQGHVPGQGGAARLQALPCWQLLPGHQDGHPHGLPGWQVWRQVLLHHPQRLPGLPHQRECVALF